MTLTLAWDLRGSSTEAGAARPPPFPSRQGRALPTAGTSCEKGEPPLLPALQAPSPTPVPGTRQLGRQELCRRLKPRAKVCHQTQQLWGEESLQTDRPELPVPLRCHCWLPGRSAPFCFFCSPAALHEPVQVTEQAKNQPSWNQCSFQLG